MLIYDSMWYPDERPDKFEPSDDSRVSHWPGDLGVYRLPMLYEGDVLVHDPFHPGNPTIAPDLADRVRVASSTGSSIVMLDVEEPLIGLISPHQSTVNKAMIFAFQILLAGGEPSRTPFFNIPFRAASVSDATFVARLDRMAPFLMASCIEILTFSCYPLTTPVKNAASVRQLGLVRRWLDDHGRDDVSLLAFVSTRIDRPKNQGGWYERARIPFLADHCAAIRDEGADGLAWWGPAFGKRAEHEALGKAMQRVVGREEE